MARSEGELVVSWRGVEAQHDSPINMPSCFYFFFKEEKRDLHEQYNIRVCK